MSTYAYYNSFYKELAEMDARGNDFSKISDLLPVLNDEFKVLDVGAGYGQVSCEFIRRGYDVYAMEINDDAIHRLSEKGFHSVKRDFNEPWGLNHHFDLILLLDVLEHALDPMHLLDQSKRYLKRDGSFIISVPLYFDLMDRLRILFTGSIVSYDNRCYGRDLYRRFRSYNYDHIRFFRPRDVLEMVRLSGLSVEKLLYGAIPASKGFTRYLIRTISNKYTTHLIPNLFAHSMRMRAKLSDSCISMATQGEVF